jgi:DNA-cytosine methyltransferase
MDTVLSLFDGLSGARIALSRLGIEPKNYIASEIDRSVIRLAHLRYPTTRHVGNVQDVTFNGHVNLLIGGSPCQDLSIAGPRRRGLAGERSGLFFEYLRVLEETKPDYWLLENVNSMSTQARREITKNLGVEPIMINADLVSGQSRRRLYWTNIPNVTQPTDRGILLRDVIDEYVNPKYIHTPAALEYMKRLDKTGRNKWDYGYHSDTNNPKSATITANFHKGVPNNVLIDRIHSCYRKFTPTECERLQTLPENYTDGLSDSARYKAIGNGFCIDVIAHILSFIPT